MRRNQQYEMKNMSGVLFKNEDKDPQNEDHDKWADYRGRIKFDGIEYWLNAWINVGQNSGKTYMSLAVNEMDQDPPPRRRQGNGRPAPRQQSSPRQQQRTRPQRDPDLDNEPDDIPF